jgi:hypothetical protein
MTRSQKEIRKIVADRLKAIRIQAGYSSQKTFCEQHGFPLAHYQKHEDAECAMVASEIIQYCSALEISIYYLMLGEEAETLKKTQKS